MKLTDKELEEYAKSVKAREYEKYSEEDEQMINSCLSEKEMNKLEGKGFINKIAKHFKDKQNAKVLSEIESIQENINSTNVLDYIPEEYKEGADKNE